MNERTKMRNRLIDYAQADPPVLFSVNDAATAADLDEAVRIISCLPPLGEGAGPCPADEGDPK